MCIRSRESFSAATENIEARIFRLIQVLGSLKSLGKWWPVYTVIQENDLKQVWA